MTTSRYAIYYTPPPFSALARFGTGILGYDCFSGTEVAPEPPAGIDPSLFKLMTVDPRRYGFHATIVAPFHLNHRSEGDLIASAERFASRTAPEPVGTLAVSLMGAFVTLIPGEDRPGICRFASECLKAFDGFRAPLSASDRERRMRAGLSAVQIELLNRWGYPYVLDQFRFHMTLAGPIPEEQRRELRDLLWKTYQERAASTVEIDAISVMRQDDSDSRFRVLRRCRLKG